MVPRPVTLKPAILLHRQCSCGQSRDHSSSQAKTSWYSTSTKGSAANACWTMSDSTPGSCLTSKWRSRSLS
ncbi:hypothetical protein BC834DRAFT_862858 [Gloeopeniophorella convolvens]|nr:hypothetical protein BC834DRAFT_862858 [Gloeopeniophorella convolvens]